MCVRQQPSFFFLECAFLWNMSLYFNLIWRATGETANHTQFDFGFAERHVQYLCDLRIFSKRKIKLFFVLTIFWLHLHIGIFYEKYYCARYVYIILYCRPKKKRNSNTKKSVVVWNFFTLSIFFKYFLLLSPTQTDEIKKKSLILSRLIWQTRNEIYVNVYYGKYIL